MLTSFLFRLENPPKTLQTKWGADILSQDDVEKILLDLKDDQQPTHTHDTTQVPALLSYLFGSI